MDPNNFRRGRSPPFGYHQPRPPMDDFDNPHNYVPVEQIDGPTYAPYQMGLPPVQQQSLPSHVQPPFMDGPSHHHQHHHHEYPPEYRDTSRMQPNQHHHRIAMPQRDPYAPNPANHQPRASSPPYKILCISNLNQKISDGPIKEALTSDFARFGDISVSVCHDNGERFAYIYFRNYEEAREARSTRMRTVLFDRPIEIEPIYEPAGPTPPPPQPAANTMLMPGQSIYHSPRQRSVSPPPPSYPQEPINGPLSHRRVLPPRSHHMPYSSAANHPSYPYAYGTPPPEYLQAQSHAPGNPYGQTLPPTMASSGLSIPYDRRMNYEEGNYNHYPSPHGANVASPYSTPPHEHYRPPYPPSQVPPSNSHHPVSRGEREQIPPTDPRSPRSDAYHQLDPRGPPPNFPPVEQLSRRSSSRSRHRNRHRSRARHSTNPSRLEHPGDPPARFMSREFRREKFGGSNHGQADHDEGKPSRVLLVNNIDLSKTESDLRDTFESYGTIEDMEIKKVAPEISSAIIKFTSMDGAYKAKTANNGRFIGSLRCRIVYGKVSASRKLWIGGLSPLTTISSLESECSRFGDIICMEYTQSRPYCYIEFLSANQAQFAAHHLRSTLIPAPERKIRVEFVDLERSERLVPRQNTSSNSNSADLDTNSRANNDLAYEPASSPRPTNDINSQKRDLTPESDVSKRVCLAADLPLGSNTFKQERLAAAAAVAKARSSSTASSHPSDRLDSNTRDSSDSNEVNNNGDEARAKDSNLLDSNSTTNSFDNSALEAPSLEKLTQCTSVREVLNCCPVSWPGRIALKNSLFPAHLYLCSGNKELIDKYLIRHNEDGSTQSPLLSITQRWRLHPQPKLEVVKRRMESGNLGILIITSRQETQKESILAKNESEQTPSAEQGKLNATESHVPNGSFNENPSDITGSDSLGTVNPKDESTSGAEAMSEQNSFVCTPNRSNSTPTLGQATQSKSIRNLISYLGQKDAAGVISLSAYDCATSEPPRTADNPPKLLYTFPPGEFALNLLRRMASNLAPEATKEEFLLGVISRGNLDGKI